MNKLATLLLTICLATGCYSEKDAFSGEWVNVINPQDTLDISRTDNDFSIKETYPNTFTNNNSVSVIPAKLENNQLKTQGIGNFIYIYIDKKTGHLMFSKTEFERAE